MQIIHSILVKKGIFYKIFIVVALLTSMSCARKINFQTSSVVPAARGAVKIKKDANQNYVISIDLFNLAEATRLPTSEKTYVVWMESENQFAKNLGQINSSTKMLSKKLKASFETVSPVKPTKIFITVEDGSNVQYPGNNIILTTSSF